MDKAYHPKEVSIFHYFQMVMLVNLSWKWREKKVKKQHTHTHKNPDMVRNIKSFISKFPIFFVDLNNKMSSLIKGAKLQPCFIL